MTMTAPVIGLPAGRPLTIEDLELMPDDGHRYELIDGVLIVSPAPRPMHQRGVVRLSLLLHEACPDDLELFVAPFDVRLAKDTLIQPDLLVTQPIEAGDPRDVVPVLAVEILSPSTRMIDLHVKKERLARAGCPHYWVVDADRPSVTAWRLVGDDYDPAGEAVGASELVLDDPFPVRIVPRDLVVR